MPISYPIFVVQQIQILSAALSPFLPRLPLPASLSKLLLFPPSISQLTLPLLYVYSNATVRCCSLMLLLSVSVSPPPPAPFPIITLPPLRPPTFPPPDRSCRKRAINVDFPCFFHNYFTDWADQWKMQTEFGAPQNIKHDSLAVVPSNVVVSSTVRLLLLCSRCSASARFRSAYCCRAHAKMSTPPPDAAAFEATSIDNDGGLINCLSVTQRRFASFRFIYIHL